MISGLVVAQILARNLWNTGLSWSDELARMCGIALVFLTVPWLALTRANIAVDLVRNLAGPAIGRWIDILAELSVALFTVLTLMGFATYLKRAAHFTTPSLGLPNLWFYMPALVGISLLLLVSLLNVLRLLTREATMSEPAPLNESGGGV
nr:TRAP transporter small permease subunit [Acuticoccus kalidii]